MRVCDQVESILADVYQPETSREDAIAAIGDCWYIPQGNAPDDADADDSDYDDVQD